MADKSKDLFTDLGLTYEQAAHGVQSAISTRIGREGLDPETSFAGPKHLRTGHDMRASDACGLAALLMDKGLIERAEYLEYMRLAANHELATHEKEAARDYGRPVSFR